MLLATNKLQRNRSERVTDYIMRFEEGIKTLHTNEINLLTNDDVPRFMLVSKASLTHEGPSCTTRRTLRNQRRETRLGETLS